MYRSPRKPCGYGSPVGTLSDFLFIFHFFIFVFNFLLFTSPFCFSVEIFVFIFYFSVFAFNVLIFTSLWCLSIFYFFTFPFLFLSLFYSYLSISFYFSFNWWAPASVETPFPKKKIWSRVCPPRQEPILYEGTGRLYIGCVCGAESIFLSRVEGEGTMSRVEGNISFSKKNFFLKR